MPGTASKLSQEKKGKRSKAAIDPTEPSSASSEGGKISSSSIDPAALLMEIENLSFEKTPPDTRIDLRSYFKKETFKNEIQFRNSISPEELIQNERPDLNYFTDISSKDFNLKVSTIGEKSASLDPFLSGAQLQFSRERQLVDAVRRLPADHALRAFIVLDALGTREADKVVVTADLAFGPKAASTQEVTTRLLLERLMRSGSDEPGPLNKLFSASITAAEPISHNRSARRERRQMLLGTREFGAIMTMIRGDRELQREIAPFLKRSAEYHSGRVDPEAARLGMSKNMQRQACHTTALFAGLVNSPRLNWVLQRAIDRKVDTDSTLIWKRLRGSEVVSFPELISGSGVHSANYLSTRFMMVPDKMGIVAERRAQIGGEFWLAPAGLWNMNSETNRFGPDVGLAPGGYGSLNGMGPMAVVQQSDLEGAVYGSNAKVGAAARINIVNSALSVSNADTVAVYQNNELARSILPEQIVNNAPADAIVLELRDPRTFERGFVVVDRHIYAGGLGKANEGFDVTDQTTVEILAEEYAKAARGEKAQIYTFDGLNERLGDPSQPHPLQGIDEAVILGGGDGQRIELEALRGHFKLGRTTKQLDSIDKITIFGAEYEDRDEFLEKARPRYAPAAIELAGDIDNFRHSTDLSKLKAYRLRRTDKGKIVLILKNPESGEITEYIPTGKNPVIANLTGFKVDGLQVFESLGRKFYTPAQAVELGEQLLKEGTIVRHNPQSANLPGTSARVDQTKIMRVENSSDSTAIVVEVTTTEGLRVPRKYVFYNTDIQKVAREFFSDPSMLMVGEFVKPVDSNKIVYAHTNGVSEEGASQLTPVARQIGGLEIYAIGPTAKLPLTMEAKRLIELLGVSENTVAIWVYQRGVTLAATYFAQKDRNSGGKPGILPGLMRIETRELPAANLSTRSRTATITFNPAYVANKLPFDMNRSDLMRLAACVSIGESKVPKSLKTASISFKVELIDDEKKSNGLKYRVKFPVGFPQSAEYRDIVKNFLSDPDIQFGIHEKLIPPKTGMARNPEMGRIGLNIEIPIGKYSAGRRLQPERMVISEYEL